MRPTNPIPPETATTVPVSRVVRISSCRRSRLALTPRAAPASSPSTSAFEPSRPHQQQPDPAGDHHGGNRQGLPLRAGQPAEQPEDDLLLRGGAVGPGEHERGHSGEQVTDGDADQDQPHRQQPAAVTGHREHHGHRRAGTGERRRGQGQHAERGRAGRQHQHRADRGAVGQAEQVRIGDRVAHDALHDRPRQGQARAHDRAEQHAREADPPDDQIAGGRGVASAGQVVQQDPGDLTGRYTDRADAGGQQRRHDEHDGQRRRAGCGRAEPRRAVSTAATHRCASLVDRGRHVSGRCMSVASCSRPSRLSGLGNDTSVLRGRDDPPLLGCGRVRQQRVGLDRGHQLLALQLRRSCSR